MTKQLRIAGIESEQHADINEAAEELRAAKEEQKADSRRSADRVAMAHQVLVARMLAAKVSTYGFKTDDGYIGIELGLPEPIVRLKFESEES